MSSHTEQMRALDVLNVDRACADAARSATAALLRAQLRAGQHILPFLMAIDAGAAVGLRACDIRPAAGDPTVKFGAVA